LPIVARNIEASQWVANASTLPRKLAARQRCDFVPTVSVGLAFMRLRMFSIGNRPDSKLGVKVEIRGCGIAQVEPNVLRSTAASDRQKIGAVTGNVFGVIVLPTRYLG